MRPAESSQAENRNILNKQKKDHFIAAIELKPTTLTFHLQLSTSLTWIPFQGHERLSINGSNKVAGVHTSHTMWQTCLHIILSTMLHDVAAFQKWTVTVTAKPHIVHNKWVDCTGNVKDMQVMEGSSRIFHIWIRLHIWM